jgi:hypothetical protein
MVLHCVSKYTSTLYWKTWRVSGTNRGATTGAVISKHIEHGIHFQCLHVLLCSLVVCKCSIVSKFPLVKNETANYYRNSSTAITWFSKLGRCSERYSAESLQASDQRLNNSFQSLLFICNLTLFFLPSYNRSSICFTEAICSLALRSLSGK